MARTMQLARRAGWPLRKNYSNGNIFILNDIDATGNPVYYRTHNTNAGLLTQTATVYSGGTAGLSLSGSSPKLVGKLGIWDGGRALTTHREFGGSSSRVRNMETTGDIIDHTTHLAGTLVAQGLNPAVRGMAYGASLQVWDLTNDISEIATAAGQLLLSNHAYGPVVGWVLNPDRPGNNLDQKWEWWGNPAISQTEDYVFGFYTSRTADLDRILYNNPFYLAVRSADNKHAETGPPANTPYYLRSTNEKSTLARSRNNGYDVLAAEATAKNGLTVGAADVAGNYEQPGRATVSAYSGWGPTDDGRIKPDLLGMGVPILSTLASGTAAYGNLMGTSMASANVTGSLLLLQELYTQQHPGKFMRAATLRTLALHTATRIGASSAQGLRPPDYKQGWGLLNMREAAQVLLNDNNAHALEELTLLNRATYSFPVTAQGNEPLVVTIGWTDPEASPTTVSSRSVNSRTPKLVNDLDLRILDGSQASNPWILNPDQPDKPATTGDNIRDNTEQVVVQNPVPGRTYTIRITHKNDLKYNSQPVSLVVSGLRRASCQLAVSLATTTDTTYCPGKSITLRAAQAKTATSGALTTEATYQWLLNGQPISGRTNSTASVDKPGSYALRITDRNGCVGTSAPVIIRTLSTPSDLTPTTNQLICPTRPSVRLSVPTRPNTTYEWLREGQPIPRETGPACLASQPGQYTVRVSQQGCQATSSAVTVESDAQLQTDISPIDSEIRIPTGTSVRLQVTSTGVYQYQWLRNEQSLSGAITNRWLANQPGLYRVRLSQEGCTALSSVRQISWTNSTLTALPDSLLQFAPTDSILVPMPNPASEQITIQYFHPLTTRFISTLYNGMGNVVMDDIQFESRDGVLRTTLPIWSLPAGHYFLQVIDGPRVRRTRFIKR